MKLYLLWNADVGCDDFAGFVIRAENEQQARGKAAEAAAIVHNAGTDPKSETVQKWHWPETTVSEIAADGPCEIILSDYREC